MAAGTEASEEPFVVVGVDGSENSQRALYWAARQAQGTGAKVKAVATWNDPYTLVGPHPPVAVAGPERHRLRHMLDRVAAGVQEETGVAMESHVVGGAPAPTLTRLAAGADMLVLGTRGLGGFKGLLLGSVSQRCVQLATCPVVLVPPSAGDQSHRGADSRGERQPAS
ncbi:MAG TPA: universal stress protein [Acidimicrobiales bacterium]|jgi:nucleotide-binding universal stress UspA family protein|nr:universal stress protein [Acidimicrobiales bacterium]